VQRTDPSFKKQYASAELPQHRVRIARPFLMGVHEVTKGQFARFVRERNYRTEVNAAGTGYNQQGKVEAPNPQFNSRNTGYPYEDNQPVVNVSWHDAVAFCQWLSAKEQREYHLPTEAQWEYACRAGTHTLYSHGDDPEGLALVGNVADGTAKAKFKNWNAISTRDNHVYTAPVGHFRANAFGLCDMHGNVQEWCADGYASNAYANAAAADPLGPETSTLRVVRGGNFEISAGYCRSANRVGRAPFGRSCSLGFRIVVAIP
jgi:formylglycine-generating enzyme required for sulfatase activity